MIRPDYLKQQDKVVIISTARKISQDELQPAIDLFSSWGLLVEKGEHLLGSFHQFSGTDEERLSDLQKALDSSDIKAVFFARGGYGTARLLDRLNLEGLKKHPKWLVGYSDLTALHLHVLAKLGMESLHATMPINISANPDPESQKSIDSLHNLLFGKATNYELPAHELNKPGEAEGLLVGGNLSIIYSLLGSDSIPTNQNIVLFLEDLDEYLYHVDRMMLNLVRNGLLNRVAAILVGGMSDMNDNDIPFGKTAEQIIHGWVADTSFPVYFGVPFGHQKTNLALPHGRKVRIINNKLFL